MIAALLFLFLSAPARAQDAVALFKGAKEAYARGDHAAAKESYERLVEEGYGGAALYQDLGDACFRLGLTSRARLWYERALEENPRDEDLRHDRDLTRTRLGISDEEDPGALGAWAAPLAWAVTLLNLIFFGFLGWGLFHQNEGLWWARAAAGLLLLASAGTYAAARTEAHRSWGIAMERIEARGGPGEGQTAAFVVPEGRRVEILRREGDWIEVGVPSQGLKGWARRTQAEPVRLS